MTLFYVYTYLLIIYEASAVVNFRITSFKTCTSSSSILDTVNGITVKQCVEECSSLFGCSAVNYKRFYKRCELHSNQHENRVARPGESCVYIKRSDMQGEDLSTGGCQGCDDGDTCDNTKCVPKSCAAFEVKNGVIHGNMKAVGSRVEIACYKLFKDISGKTHAVCQRNGSWTHRPNCTLGYTYMGCYQDTKDRILSEKHFSSRSMTTEMCVMECFDSGFIYAQTQ
ncbi:uncharacterized protein LOC132759949, partial [Ruditapes philippinarum]|uniref:uncharacterized protein LOC132759949 n=1 Tax=Ruditapes philippinarum TaxID=129788 RepID=UPI00295B3144